MKALTKRAIVAALALVGATAVQAQVTELPPVNNMTVGVYGDFYVYSLELLDKCSAAGDARCLPSGPYPDPSNTATIGNYVLIYKNSQGGSQGNYQLPTGPLSAPQTVDNPFDSLTGVGSSFDMDPAGEPNGLTGNNYGSPNTADFAGDKIGTWEASLASINSFLNGQQLFFWFGNNQDGASLDQVQYLWAQVRLTKSDGTFVTSAEVGGKSTCWELNSTFSLPTNPNGMGTGCDLVNEPYYETDITKRTPLAAGDFVGTGGAFCVDKSSGESYVPLNANGTVNLPGKDADCAVAANRSSDGKAHTAGYFISNNLGQNSTEFAAFLPTLNANLNDWAAAGYFMSINFKVRNLNDGGDQLWIRGVGEQTIILVPEPASLALVGLGLLGAVGLSRRRRAA